MIVCCLLIFFKINFFKKFIQEHQQSIKQLESRSGQTLCIMQALFGYKLFAKVISRMHKQVKSLRNIYSKTCVKRSLWKRQKLVIKTNFPLMQVKSIAEYSKGSILQYFWPSLSYHLSLRSLSIFSGHFTQVLLYSEYITQVLLATDACLTADPGVASSIPVRSHTFVEIDHEIISTVILLPSADLFKKGCCQLHAKVCARITG